MQTTEPADSWKFHFTSSTDHNKYHTCLEMLGIYSAGSMVAFVTRYAPTTYKFSKFFYLHKFLVFSNTFLQGKNF